MAYSDKEGKTILDAFGKFQSVLYADCEVGDLIARDTSNEGWILADDSTGITASAVAIENGSATDTIWMALAAVVETPPTESGGDYSDTACALAADVMDTLYLGESGKVEDSAGTTPQVVGFIISTTRFVLCPNTYITGTDQTLSGNLVVGGTASVTGNTTLTGTLTCNGNVTLGSGDTLTLTKGDITLTEGELILTKGSVVQTVTAVAETGPGTIGGVYLVDTSSADVTLTLPAASAGLVITAACTSATKQLIITAATGDKLINASGEAKDKATGNAAAYNNITLVAVDGTNWITTGFQGTWTYA